MTVEEANFQANNSKLPAEILCSIFSHITDNYTLCQIPLVCKHWCYVARSEGLDELLFKHAVKSVHHGLSVTLADTHVGSNDVGISCGPWRNAGLRHSLIKTNLAKPKASTYSSYNHQFPAYWNFIPKSFGTPIECFGTDSTNSTLVAVEMSGITLKQGLVYVTYDYSIPVGYLPQNETPLAEDQAQAQAQAQAQSSSQAKINQGHSHSSSHDRYCIMCFDFKNGKVRSVFSGHKKPRLDLTVNIIKADLEKLGSNWTFAQGLTKPRKRRGSHKPQVALVCKDTVIFGRSKQFSTGIFIADDKGNHHSLEIYSKKPLLPSRTFLITEHYVALVDTHKQVSIYSLETEMLIRSIHLPVSGDVDSKIAITDTHLFALDGDKLLYISWTQIVKAVPNLSWHSISIPRRHNQEFYLVDHGNWRFVEPTCHGRYLMLRHAYFKGIKAMIDLVKGQIVYFDSLLMYNFKLCPYDSEIKRLSSLDYFEMSNHYEGLWLRDEQGQLVVLTIGTLKQIANEYFKHHKTERVNIDSLIPDRYKMTVF